MRKFYILLIAIAAFASACTQQGRWSRQQVRDFRHWLNDYREMVYLDGMDDAEFIIFADDVTGLLEDEYPDYVEFIQMTGMGDTVDMVIVETIVDDLQANHNNMRYFFPYEWLKEWSILPEGMKHKELRAFYDCFAASVNKSYGSLDAFVYAAINSTVDDQKILSLARQCAAPYQQMHSSSAEHKK